MNNETGHVSPQFHCKYDVNFDTTTDLKELQIIWQLKAGFVFRRSTRSSIEEKGDTPKHVILEVPPQQEGSIPERPPVEDDPNNMMIPKNWRSKRECKGVNRLTYSYQTLIEQAK